MEKTTKTTRMELRRARKERKGLLNTGMKVINLEDGNTYFFINGKPGKIATIVSKEVVDLAVKRKQEDEKKDPMLAGLWHQYVMKNEKVLVETDSLLTADEYDKVTNTAANKALLSKLEKAESKKQKLSDDLDSVVAEIKSINSELIATVKATA